MTSPATPVINEHEHVCLIYYGETSRRPVLLQWAIEGIGADEAVMLVERDHDAQPLLELVGDRAFGGGVVVDPANVYGRGGGDVLTDVIVAEAIRDTGRRIGRVSLPAMHALAFHDAPTYLGCERALADRVADQPTSVLCQYDRILVGDDLVVRAAAEHTLVVQLDDLALPTLDLRPIDHGIRVSGEIDRRTIPSPHGWRSIGDERSPWTART